MVPYSVFCPSFEIASGGIRVMWGLYGWLLAKGQVAFTNTKIGDMPFIAIYPEIVNGNPLGANKVVRYILNKPGVMRGRTPTGGLEPGPTEFDKSDQIYVFSELFNTMGVNDRHHMFLPILDLHLWKDQGKKRTKKAVFFGKGSDLGLHPEGCVVLNRFNPDQEWLANTLNECEVLYQYDPVSAMSEIARLCGCRVVMLQNTYSKDDYLKKYEPGVNGIGWGEDVPLDVKGFRDHYINLRGQFSRKLDLFIEDTQK